MRLLQRYILKELLKVFVFVLSALTILLVLVGVVREASENGFGPKQIQEILPYIVPSMLPFTIPATFLLTVCVVYGRIASDQEITAAKAAGINVWSLLWPSFFLGGILSVCALLLTDQVIPWSEANIKRIAISVMEDVFLERLRSQNRITTPDGSTAISVIAVEERKLIGPIFRYAPRGRTAVTVSAREATIDFDHDRHEVVLHLVDSSLVSAGRGSISSKHEVQRFPLPMDTDPLKPRHLSIRQISEKLDSTADRIEQMSRRRTVDTAFTLTLGDFNRFHQHQFAVYADRLHNARSEFARFHTELHGRFALACSCFFFVLVGTPFSILRARRQFLTSFFLVFLPIVIGYYPIVLLMMNLAKTGDVNPAWAMWIGNALLCVAACFVLRAALRR